MFKQIDIAIQCKSRKSINRLCSLHRIAGVRRIQRVSDVNAMGYVTQPAAQQPFVPNAFAGDASAGQTFNYDTQAAPQVYAVTAQAAEPAANYYDPFKSAGTFAPPAQPQFAPMPSGPAIFDPSAGAGAAPQPPNSFATQLSMLQQPMVQDMAMQYGQRLADHGKQLVESQFEKYVPVTRLKYYFAVDNNYVVRKLVLLLFPFTHKVCTKCAVSAPFCRYTFATVEQIDQANVVSSRTGR